MNDQPMPTPGQRDVTPIARLDFLETLAEREAKGIATYGTTLQTHNGRDALIDAIDESVDLFQYLTQARMERDDLYIQVTTLTDENARLRAENSALRGEQP